MNLSPEVEALKNKALLTSTVQWAKERGWPLRQVGNELIGPCPKAGCGGRDRFGINMTTGTWNCRVCGVGGDVIFLVQHVEGLAFVAALERITGQSAAAPIDPVEAEETRLKNEEHQRQQDEIADRKREEARRAGWDILCRAGASDWWWNSPVGQYLALRGMPADRWGNALILKSVRLFVIPEHPYVEKVGNRWVELHRGPAMIAAVRRPDSDGPFATPYDAFGAVHQTWIDLRQPKGKLVLPPAEDGKEYPSKKVRGSKKGGAIRLYTPDDARRIVMGEGIETTLTALVHAFDHGTAYWAGVDLGNMAGKALRGPTGGLVHDQPDMDDLDCFLPPDWCEELVYLCDGDEAEKHTIEKVTRGLRRAQRYRAMQRAEQPELPPLSIKMVPPAGPDTDLNSIAMAEAAAVADDKETTDA